MAITDWIPQVWSARFLRKLEENRVWGNLVDRSYQEGEIIQFGNSLKIPTWTKDFTVQDYAIGTPLVAPEEADGEEVTLLVNKQKYFSFKVEDIQQAQARPSIIDRAVAQSATNMANQIEADIEAEFATNIGAGTLIAETAEVGATGNAFAIAMVNRLNEVNEVFDSLNVPQEGRWCVMPRQAISPLSTYIINLTSTPVAADSALRNGFTGNLLGFRLYARHSVMRTSKTFDSTANTEVQRIVCGQGTQQVAHVEQIDNVETIRMDSAFADNVRGLMVYGTKSTEGSTLRFIEFKDTTQDA